MTKEAANCLLKTLEEPPSFITIIMTGSNESMFLNTIKSRCMKINFKKIENEKLKEYLEKTKKYEVNDSILKLSEGSIEKAIRFYEKKEDYEKIIDIFNNIEKYQLLDVINKLEFLYNNRENIFEILDYINILLQSKLLDKPKYIQYIEAVEQTKKRLKANSNYDMSIDSMLYKIWEE